MKTTKIIFWILSFGIFNTVGMLPVFAQQDHVSQTDTVSLRSDDSVRLSVDSLKEASVETDTLAVDNTETVDLMIRSQAADMESSVKESVLLELLQNTGNFRQRQELERQIKILHAEDSLRRAMQRHRIDSLKRTAVGAPVMLKRDTLYFIYTNMGAISASERAKLQSQKILRLAKVYSLKSDSLYITDISSTSDIVCGDLILASVTENDALWMGTTRDSLAREEIRIIVDAIIIYKKRTSLWNTLQTIGLFLLVIIVLYILFKGIKYLFNHVIRRAIIARRERLFKGMVFRDFEILDAKKQMKMILRITNFVKYIVYLILLYLSIPLIFSIFPATQRIAETLFDWVLTPLKSGVSGFIAFLPNLIKIIIILVVVHYIMRFFKYLSREIEDKRLVLPGFYPDWAKTSLSIIRIVIYAFAAVLIFQLLPWSKSPVFQGVSVFLGLLISFGSTSVISNIMSGMVITYMRPFVKGDRIKIGETYGDVIEKTSFVVRILTTKNEVVTVPNSTVLTTNVINYSAKAKESSDPGVILNTIVTVSYDVSWVQVNQLLTDAALKTRFVLHKPAPFVLQTALNDFSASYQINAYTKEVSKMPLIYSELYKNIQYAFRDAGIEMVLPHYQAIRDGNASTIPPSAGTGENSK